MFSMEIILPPELGGDAPSRIHESMDGASDHALVANVLRCHVYPGLQEGPPRYALVFAPPTLVDSALEQAEAGSLHLSSFIFFPIPASTREKLSYILLSMLHPYLARNFSVKAIFATRGQQHAPADFVLVDLSHSPIEIVNDILETTNSQLIHSGPDAVLKNLLIYKIVFSSEGEERAKTASLHPPRADIPSCAVCLHRVHPRRLGLPKPLTQSLCSQYCPAPNPTAASDVCPRQRLLHPWARPSRCVACIAIANYWAQEDHTDESMELFCHDCALQQTLWVCLTCGFVGCGRYSNKHAESHYHQSGHPYCLELPTLRIWDYVIGGFAHRSDQLECPSAPTVVHRLTHPEASFETDKLSASQGPALPRASFDDKSPKKATMIGEEYEALLQSALEEQAHYYEGEISSLRAEVTAQQVDRDSMSEAERHDVEQLRLSIRKLRSNMEQAGKNLLDIQAQEAGHRATSQRLLREQQGTQDQLKKIQEETERENDNGRMQIEELEQQIADLTANQRMRHQFTHDEELLNAQIFGTMGNGAKSSNKKGKKVRRSIRK